MKKIIVWALALALLLGVVSIAEEIRANGYDNTAGRIFIWSLMQTPTAEAIGAWVSDAAETAVDAWNSFVHAPLPAED